MSLSYQQRQAIADRLNATLPGNPAITRDQVFAVETGLDVTPSHPVWQIIDKAIRDEQAKGEE